MKTNHFILTVFFALLGATGFSQDSTETIDYSIKTSTLDQTINALYTVISGEKGEERDWELFKFLFHPEAKLIPSRKNKEGTYNVRYMTPQNYIDTSGEWLINNGFYEKELARTTETFGNITQVFSSYESFRSKTDEAPFMRGINSIQLLNDGTRWWIINIYWTQESEENPIPQKYLPKN
ncbi:MAG: hypothetical protein BM564_07355 [Bacteroidetes bacterium MedPE-SWsnd-G2]|nr:MAG: hypothetical protein BM564_07355 [Bacteroidetes bacterium MedPE-SWsnd-G2]